VPNKRRQNDNLMWKASSYMTVARDEVGWLTVDHDSPPSASVSQCVHMICLPLPAGIVNRNCWWLVRWFRNIRPTAAVW